MKAGGQAPMMQARRHNSRITIVNRESHGMSKSARIGCPIFEHGPWRRTKRASSANLDPGLETFLHTITNHGHHYTVALLARMC